MVVFWVGWLVIWNVGWQLGKDNHNDNHRQTSRKYILFYKYKKLQFFFRSGKKKN